MTDGPIQRYLHELRGRVPGGPLRRRRVLGELRAHLEDAAEKEQEAGRTREEAERLAVERFGVPFPDRQRRWVSWIPLPLGVGVIVVAAVAVAVESGGSAGQPHARTAAIPYDSVPFCSSAGSGPTPSTATAMIAGRMRIVAVACRPQPAVGTPRSPVAVVGSSLPDGATAVNAFEPR